jgi:hypothetical protein
MVKADGSNGVVVDVLVCGTTFAAGATALCGPPTANVWTIEYDGRYRTTRNCYPDIMINHAGSNGDAEWNAVCSAPITSLDHA